MRPCSRLYVAPERFASPTFLHLGIDRPDIEAVIHVDVPGSIEAYRQEIGRRRRGGRLLIATLLFRRPSR